MFTRQIFILTLLPLLLFSLSGCRDTETTQPMAHSEVEASNHDMGAMHEQHGAMKMEHKKPPAEPAESVALPENFPSDVPIYPGARVAISNSTTDGATIGMETDDDRKKVVHYYETKLAAQGWKLDTTSNTKFKSILQGKKENRSCAITVNQHTKLRKTTISVIIMR